MLFWALCVDADHQTHSSVSKPMQLSAGTTVLTVYNVRVIKATVLSRIALYVGSSLVFQTESCCFEDKHRRVSYN